MSEATEGSTQPATWRYVNAAQPAQQLISRTLTQIAGFALLAMTSKRPLALAEGALLGAQQASLQAIEAVRALEAHGGASHHLHHLRQAAAMLRQACASALRCLGPEASEGEREALVRALRAASHHLRATARLLPGFELVDLHRACCAAHASQLRLCEA